MAEASDPQFAARRALLQPLHWPVLAATLRSVGALFIVYVFVAMLMTASAQQSVITLLTGLPGRPDFNSGFVTFQSIKDLQAKRDFSTQIVRKLRRDATAQQGIVDAAKQQSDDAWQSLVVVAGQDTGGGCRLQATPSGRESDLWMTISEVRDCLDDGVITRSRVDQVKAALQSATSAINALSQQTESLDVRQSAAKALDAEIADYSAQISVGAPVASTFDGTDKLGALGAGWLFDFPPALVQILLAFCGGAFGALLLTLVLIVYPSTGFTMVSAGGYGARILLGGLIGLCIFVIMNGGTAVLGATSGLPGAGANYMAFCGVAILAGMFSDRVAAWLSARANVFFGSKAS